MSYDVSIRPAGLSPDAQADVASGVSTDGTRRVEAALAAVRGLEPGAEIDEQRDHGVLTRFVVVESERLPYLEVGAHDGMLSASAGGDPSDLYRSLHEVTRALHASGYALFDHQLGAGLEPAASFRDFMLQHRSMWDSPEAFERWLDSVEPPTRSDAHAPRKQARQGSAFTVIALVLVALWGAYKLHKAGYF